MKQTNMPGFMKDDKGLIHNVDQTRIEHVRNIRRQYKEQKSLESRIAALENKFEQLEKFKTKVLSWEQMRDFLRVDLDD